MQGCECIFVWSGPVEAAGYLAKPSPFQLDKWKPSHISCKTLPNKKKVHYFTMESGQTSVNLIEKYGTDKLDQVIVYTQKELTCFVKDHAFNSHISVKVKSQGKTVIYNTSCDWKAVYTHEAPLKSRSKEQCKYNYSKTSNCEHSTLCSSQRNPTKAQMMKMPSLIAAVRGTNNPSFESIRLSKMIWSI